MPTAPSGPTDLRALLQDRKAKNGRPSVRATICFQPDLLEELNELVDEREARRISHQGDEPDPDPRLGRKSFLSQRISDLEAAVAAASVVAVFRVPTRERQAELNKLAEDGEDMDPLLLAEGFQHFLRGNEPIPAAELGKDDLTDWMALASQGEVNAIAYKIATRSLGTPDFPASVKQSLQSRASAAR